MVMIIHLIIGLTKIDVYRYIIPHDSVTKHLVVLVLLLLLLYKSYIERLEKISDIIYLAIKAALRQKLKKF